MNKEHSVVLGMKECLEIQKIETSEEKINREESQRLWEERIKMKIEMAQIFLEVFNPNEIELSDEEYLTPELILGIVMARDPRFFKKNDDEQDSIVENQLKTSIFTFCKERLSEEIKHDVQHLIFESNQLVA